MSTRLSFLLTGNTISHTEGLMKDMIPHFDKLGFDSEIVRIVDYNISFGVTEYEGEGDEWPQIFEKVKAADILIIGTPLWLGEKSSVATQVIERLYGGSALTNDKGQAIYYNKGGGVVVTGMRMGRSMPVRPSCMGYPISASPSRRTSTRTGSARPVRVTRTSTPAATTPSRRRTVAS